MKTLTQIETEINEKLDQIISQLPPDTIAGELKDVLRKGASCSFALSPLLATSADCISCNIAIRDEGLFLQFVFNGQVVAWESSIAFGEKRWS